jgi:predicted CopG family antitoxin
MTQITTIQIQKDTREMLREFGHKGETYDQLIRRLMEAARKLRFFQDLDRIVETEEFVPLDEV